MHHIELHKTLYIQCSKTQRIRMSTHSSSRIQRKKQVRAVNIAPKNSDKRSSWTTQSSSRPSTENPRVISDIEYNELKSGLEHFAPKISLTSILFSNWLLRSNPSLIPLLSSFLSFVDWLHKNPSVSKSIIDSSKFRQPPTSYTLWDLIPIRDTLWNSWWVHQGLPQLGSSNCQLQGSCEFL